MQLKESKEASEKKIKKERRTFLKRAAYAAPSLVVLGSLTRPLVANEIGSPIDPPNSKGFSRP